MVPTDGKLATTATDPVWRFQLNTKLKQSQGGPYNTADYNPAKGYVGVGGSDDNGIIEKTTVMTIVAKFPAGSAAEAYTPEFAKEDFIAGGGETIDGTDGVKISNAFGTRNVQVDSVTVNPGATVSGTVKDSSGKAVSGAAVELYKDGTKVADATAGTDGKYTISNVSTGTYTVKAKTTVDGKELNGSDEITVKANSILNADVTLQKWQKGDVNKDGEINSDDVTALLRHVSKIELLSSDAAALGDVDNNGEVNSDDVTKLLRFVSKIITNLD